MQLIECVPNFSEGKDKKIIEDIASAIRLTPNIKLLHQTSDIDHNRTVFTFIGPPESVIKAAFNATKKTAELIDLTKQEGIHPRLGATDVIPLIPLKGITKDKLIPLSHKLAEEITNKLQIPTHLYEYSAKDPQKQNLANIRLHKPKPDHTPLQPHPTAGQTTIGVREILIAFNVNLKTSDLKTAKAIAKQIRKPHLKALGLLLHSKNTAQVSMNLTNFHKVSPLQAYNEIATLAAKHNTEILESELIGLIPKEALPENPETQLKLKISPNQILNNHYI